jgi:glycerol-3-phosphate acyltransferase PlsY
MYEQLQVSFAQLTAGTANGGKRCAAIMGAQLGVARCYRTAIAASVVLLCLLSRHARIQSTAVLVLVLMQVLQAVGGAAQRLRD